MNLICLKGQGEIILIIAPGMTKPKKYLYQLSHSGIWGRPTTRIITTGLINTSPFCSQTVFINSTLFHLASIMYQTLCWVLRLGETKETPDPSYRNLKEVSKYWGADDNKLDKKGNDKGSAGCYTNLRGRHQIYIRYVGESFLGGNDFWSKTWRWKSP